MVRSVPAIKIGLFQRASCLLAIAGMLIQPVVVYAQTLPVVAAPNAPANSTPTIGSTANGMPMVLIATPNAAGVSNNIYTQYNVGTSGLILNNAQSTVLTQQAGYVTANPNLYNGSAKIILNQVNGGSASQLLGYTEVAGAKAEVVIANPSGIYCNGCGFINASRGVLTTGTPVFGGTGSLDAFHVTGGQIQVDTLGLNGSNVDQVDLIARSVRVNGQLWANQQLNVIAGANQVSYATLSAQSIAPDSNVPVKAIDVALLGGMYANKIMLLSTEAGVGVNSQGTIAAQAGDFTLNSQGQVTLAGSTTASGNVLVNAAGITNSGTLYAGQNATLTSQGQVNNSGTVAAMGNTSLSGSTIDSNGALGAGIDTGGKASGTGSLTVNATGSVTATGQNTAGGNIALSGSSLNLAGARTTAHNDVTLTATAAGGDSGNINHTGATLGAGGVLTMSAAGALINNQGRTSAGQIALNAASLSNRSGSLIQTGTSNTSVTVTGALDDSGGVLASNGQNFSVQSGSLTNDNGQIIHAGTGLLSVTTGASSNRGGTIVGNGQAMLNSSSVDNTGGSLFGQQGLTLQTTGNVTNTGGQIASGAGLTMTANTLTGSGSVTSLGDMSMGLQGNYTNAAANKIISNGNMSLTFTGNFTNNGNVQAVSNLGVTATNITNNGALGAGATLTTHSGILTNYGTMVGGSASLNATQAIYNLGPAAFIGASDPAGKLELLAPDIENRDDTTATNTQATATIYGLGQVVLAGGKDANGNYTNANLVLNSSGLIQSGGNMEVDATTLTNTRRVLTTTNTYSAAVDPTLLTTLGISLSGTTGQLNVHNPNSIGGVYIEPPHGGAMNSDYRYTSYTGTALANTLTAISPEAQLIAGGNLTANVVTLNNLWSQVAATGNIHLANGMTLNQNSWAGQTPFQVQVDYSGSYWYTTYKGAWWNLTFCDSGCSAAADIRYYALPSYDSTFTANGTISGTGVSINNASANSQLNSLGLLPGQTLSGANPGAGGGQGTPALAKATAGSVLSNLTVPSSGLYKINPAPGAQYLVTTNPAFTNYSQFLSSDYYFQQMGANPSQIQKRLGDGFYEQQLVENQVMSLTGRSVLTGYSSAQDEYMALMTSGAALAKSLNLAPGVGLSAAQVSQLTSNVVVMQEQVVDGQTVLVPVVYLAPNNQQAPTHGPVISAANIDLSNTQVFNNSGTLIASNALSLSGLGINNRNGTLQSGGLMTLNTVGNVDLTSATVKAGSLNLNAGGDLLLNTGSNTVNQTSAGGTRSVTSLGPVASLTVTNDALITTGGDFQQNAASLSVGGNLAASIGGNWQIGTVQTNETKSYSGMGGYSKTSFSQANGSKVNVGRVSSIAVGKDLTASGANINLNGGGTIQAAGNVNLTAATATSTLNSAYIGNDFSDHLQTSDQKLTGTSLQSGSNLSIQAGKDINVTGSSVTLTGNTPGLDALALNASSQGALSLRAGGNVNITDATEQHSYSFAESGKHSGPVTTKQHQSLQTSDSTLANGSAISADSVTILSGQDVNVTGSSVNALHDITVAAMNNVNIAAATSTSSSSYYRHESTTGLQLSSSGNPFSLTDSGPDVTTKANTDGTNQSFNRSSLTSGSGNLNITAGGNLIASGTDMAAKVGNLALTAGGTVALLAGQDTLNQSSSTVTVTNPNAFTKQRHTITDTYASLDYQGSTAQANSIKISSGADAVLQAAQVTAGAGGINIDAAGDLKLLAATNSSSSTHTETLSTDGMTIKADGTPNDTATRRINNKAESQNQTNQVTNLTSAGDISTHSGGDTLIQASTLNAQGGIDLSATGYATTYNSDGTVKTQGRDGVITFAAVKDNTYNSVTKSSNSMPWQSSSGGGDYVETLKLANISAGKGLSVSATGGVAIDIPTVQATPAPVAQTDAKGNVIPSVPLTAEQQAAQRQADFNKTIQNLASKPGQAWIGQLANDPKVKVQWNQVQAAVQHWNYAHDGLTQEAVIVIAIVVAYFTAGAGSSVVGTTSAVEGGAAGATATTIGGTTLATTATTAAGVSVTTYTVAGAVINAGFSALASEAAVSFANNKGDIGKTLNDMGQSQNVRNVIAAMLTAGVGADYLKTYNVESFAAKTLTGCVTGDLTGSGCQKGATTAAIMAGSAWANNAMRTSMINDSNKFTGVKDANDPSGKIYNNDTGQGSVGIDGSGDRVAGTRISIKGLQGLGTMNAVTPGDPNTLWTFTGTAINPDTGRAFTLSEALTAQGGLTGGTQALLPTFAGMPVTPGSFLDKLDESFAGPHDYMGGRIQGGYDSLGNWGVTSNTADNIRGVMAGVNIPLVLPFVIPTFLQQINLDPVMLSNTVHNSGPH